MNRNIVNGYQKFLAEMLVLEPEDWTSAEWNTLCKLSGLPAGRTERIVLHLSSIECYVNSTDAAENQEFCQKEVFLFPDGSLHLTGCSDLERQIVLPPEFGRNIFEALRTFYIEENIKQRLNHSEDANAALINYSDINKMAQEVISLKDSSDNIVDDVIERFLANF